MMLKIEFQLIIAEEIAIANEMTEERIPEAVAVEGGDESQIVDYDGDDSSCYENIL